MESQQAELELTYIKRVIESSRKSLVEKGVGYIFWGVLVVIGIGLQYSKFFFKIPLLHGYEWFVIIGFGWLVTFFLYKRKRGYKNSTSFGQQILSTLWIGAGIGLGIVGFIGSMSGTLPGLAITPVMSVILGVAYFASGKIYETKWMYFIGLGWWTGGIVLFFWHSIHTLALFGIMMILFQVIPGLYFYNKWKKEYKVKVQ
ncbi:MAG: hypothetical protein KDC42_00590 [Ignavibacteriae bacterium]|nr:hypothetical protein [Ignavibacteriota bacterium]